MKKSNSAISNSEIKNETTETEKQNNKFKINTPIFIFLWIAAAVLAFNYSHVTDNDTFFHLSIGKNILEHGFTTVDPFSMHKLNFTSQEWLSEVVFYLIYKFFSFTGLYIFQILITALILFTIYKINCLVSCNKKYLSLFVAIICTWLLQYTFIRIRPQIFTILIFALEIYVLESYLRSKNFKILLCLPVLCVFLANFHIGAFPMFFVFMLPYLADTLFKADFFKIRAAYFKGSDNKLFKTLLLFLIALLPFGIINPYGVKKLLYFTSMFNSEITKHVMEWKGPNFNSDFGIIISLTLIICSALIIYRLILTKKLFTLKSLLLFIGLTIMTMFAIRFYSYYITFFGVALLEKIEPSAQNVLAKTKNKKKIDSSTFGDRVRMVIESKPAAGVLVILVIAVPVVKTLLGSWEITHYGYYPVKAAEYIKKNTDYKNIRLFNNYDDGGYLMFNGIKVFVDSRADLYTSQFNPGCTVLSDFADIISDPENYDALFKKYDFQYILVSTEMNYDTCLSLKEDKNYELVSEEEVSNGVSYFLYKRLGNR
ncbi:MAG: hypothetical protein Q8942_10765 [Bacillota bacterium]|nr:hypothetical protein [Bacillota bacterium]